MACTKVDGTPVAVIPSKDNTVRVWNLRTGASAGEPLTGHTERAWAVACAELDGAPVAVTAGNDNTVRVWNLRTGEQTGLLATPDPQHVAISMTGNLIVSLGHDVAVFRRAPYA
ncbi:WD40 repeat domain-containing protein [Streptomyces sp. NPDC054783]